MSEVIKGYHLHLLKRQPSQNKYDKGQGIPQALRSDDPGGHVILGLKISNPESGHF